MLLERTKGTSDQLGGGPDQSFVPMPFLPPSAQNDVLAARLWIKVTVKMQRQPGALLCRQVSEQLAIAVRPINRDGQCYFATSLVVLELGKILQEFFPFDNRLC